MGASFSCLVQRGWVSEHLNIIIAEDHGCSPAHVNLAHVSPDTRMGLCFRIWLAAVIALYVAFLVAARWG